MNSESPCLQAGEYVKIPHAKLLRKLGELDSEQLSGVEDILLFWLGFEDTDLNEDS